MIYRGKKYNKWNCKRFLGNLLKFILLIIIELLIILMFIKGLKKNPTSKYYSHLAEGGDWNGWIELNNN